MTDELEKEGLDPLSPEMKNWVREVRYFHPEMCDNLWAYAAIVRDPTARLQAGNNTWDRDWLMRHYIQRLEPPFLEPDKSYHRNDWGAIYMYYRYMSRADFEFTMQTVADMAERSLATVKQQFGEVEGRIREMIANGELTDEATDLRIAQREPEFRAYVEKFLGKLSDEDWRLFREGYIFTYFGPEALKELARKSYHMAFKKGYHWELVPDSSDN